MASTANELTGHSASLVAAAREGDIDTIAAAIADIPRADIPIIVALLARVAPEDITLDQLRPSPRLMEVVRSRQPVEVVLPPATDEFEARVRGLYAEQIRPVPPVPEQETIEYADLVELVEAVCGPGEAPQSPERAA